MIWLIALMVLALPSYLYRVTLFGVPTTALELIIYLTALCLLVRQPIKITLENWSKYWRLWRWPLILIGLGAMIAVWLGDQTAKSLGLFKAFIFDPLVVLAILTGVDRLDYRRPLVWGSLMLMAVMACSVSFGGQTLDGRSLGLYGLDTTASPNFLALLVAPLTTWFVALAWSNRQTTSNTLNRVELILCVVAIILGIYTLEASGSRAGALATALASLITVGLYWLQELPRQSKIRQNLKLILVAVSVLIIGIGIWQARPNFGPEATARQATSNNLRFEIWRTTITEILPDYWPLGHGLGDYQRVFATKTADRPNFVAFITPWAYSPHNLWLNLWVNFGLLGLVGFSWLLYLGLCAGWQELSRERSPRFSLVVPAAAILLTIIIQGLVESQLYKNDLAVLFAIAFALTQIKGGEHG